MAGLVRLFSARSGLVSLRTGAAFSTSSSRRGLEDLIVTPPKEGETAPRAGRAWQTSELRLKSWDDLHGLWVVLLKERTRLHAERMMHQQARTNMPETGRYKKVKLSMNRIKQVMSQRAHTEHMEDPVTKQRLLAFINTL